MKKLIFLIVFLLFLGSNLNVNAQNNKIRLGVRIIEPFINYKEGVYSGFSKELWDKIAKNSGFETVQIKQYANVSDLLLAVEKNDVDAGVAGISITSEREEKVDFSTPMFNSGLSIMVNKNPNESFTMSLFNQIKKTIISYDFLQISLYALLLSFIFANIIYFVERRKIDGFLDEDNYFKGIVLTYWWSITAIFGQQDRQPSSKTGRVFGLIWMVLGVLFLTFFSAQVTSDLTANRINGSIENIKDLNGKKVSTIGGTTSEKFLKDNNFIFKTEENLKILATQLKNNEIDAIVFDKPPLDYIVNNEGKGFFETVGGKFTIENYGIALPRESQIRKQINLELLKLQESGEFNELKSKYFGEEI
jgi:polar amino acid transport system substrate-binding protein